MSDGDPRPPGGGGADRATAQTLVRGLEVLERVAGGTGRLADLVAETGLSRSVVQRLLTTLGRQGYLAHTEGEGWRIGMRFLEVATGALEGVDSRGLLQAELDRLAARVQDSVHVGVLDGGDVVYLAKSHGARNVQMISRVGLRIAAQNTALGKVLLAHGDPAAAAAGFDPDLAMTPRSIRDAAAYRRALATARERGYALDEEETNLGIVCLAVPLPAPDGVAPRAALSVSAPLTYMGPERVPELVAVLREHSEAISRLERAGLWRAPG